MPAYHSLAVNEAGGNDWIWETPSFRHDLRITPDGPNIRYLPESMQIKMLSNRLVCSTPICIIHDEWLRHNCAHPYFIGDDYIMFSDETDRTSFLLAH